MFLGSKLCFLRRILKFRLIKKVSNIGRKLIVFSFNLYTDFLSYYIFKNGIGHFEKIMENKLKWRRITI